MRRGQQQLSKPSAPQNLSTKGAISATSILVSWQKPRNPNGVIGYRLSFSKVSDRGNSFEVIHIRERNHFLVSKLKPFTKYIFEVSAFNLKYNLSSPSVEAMETTDQAGKV